MRPPLPTDRRRRRARRRPRVAALVALALALATGTCGACAAAFADPGPSSPPEPVIGPAEGSGVSGDGAAESPDDAQQPSSGSDSPAGEPETAPTPSEEGPAPGVEPGDESPTGGSGSETPEQPPAQAPPPQPVNGGTAQSAAAAHAPAPAVAVAGATPRPPAPVRPTPGPAAPPVRRSTPRVVQVLAATRRAVESPARSTTRVLPAAPVGAARPIEPRPEIAGPLGTVPTAAPRPSLAAAQPRPRTAGAGQRGTRARPVARDAAPAARLPQPLRSGGARAGFVVLMVLLSGLLALTIGMAFARSRPGPLDWPGFAAEVAALVAYERRSGRAGSPPATTSQAGRQSSVAEDASGSRAPRLRAVPAVDAAERDDAGAPPERSRRAG